MKRIHRRKVSKFAAALTFALLGGSSCTTPRYVGTMVSDTYVHRGFGIVLPITDDYREIRPGDRSVPARMWPLLVDESLDLDGDGRLDGHERATLYRPLLRLVSRTSTTTHVDLEVKILDRSQDDLELERFARVLAPSAGPPETVRVRTGFEGRIVEGPTPSGRQRILLVDHRVVAEQNVERRQLVSLTLFSPTLDDTTRAAFSRLVDGLILASQADRVRPGETWTPEP